MNDLCWEQDQETTEEKKKVLQEYMGLLLSNVKIYRSKICLVLWSLLGNSGKSQFLNLIGEFLGSDKVANIPIQNMNESSKFAMGSLVGKRLISIGDQTSSEIKDSSIFKQLTGGDPVKIEPKGKQPFYYQFPGGILIACNNLPMFTDDKGGHIFERLCVIPCRNSIAQEKRDGRILDKMLKEKDAVFNWCLEGLHRVLNQGFHLTKSKACDAAMQEYRVKMDTVYRYVMEAYIITGNKNDMVSKPDFDNAYINWCSFNGFTHVNKQNIKDRMEAIGCPPDKARFNGGVGVMVYRNLVKRDSNGFLNVTQEKYEQQDFPFREGVESCREFKESLRRF